MIGMKYKIMIAFPLLGVGILGFMPGLVLGL